MSPAYAPRPKRRGLVFGGRPATRRLRVRPCASRAPCSFSFCNPGRCVLTAAPPPRLCFPSPPPRRQHTNNNSILITTQTLPPLAKTPRSQPDHTFVSLDPKTCRSPPLFFSSLKRRPAPSARWDFFRFVWVPIPTRLMPSPSRARAHAREAQRQPQHTHTLLCFSTPPYPASAADPQTQHHPAVAPFPFYPIRPALFPFAEAGKAQMRFFKKKINPRRGALERSGAAPSPPPDPFVRADTPPVARLLGWRAPSLPFPGPPHTPVCTPFFYHRVSSFYGCLFFFRAPLFPVRCRAAPNDAAAVLGPCVCCVPRHPRWTTTATLFPTRAAACGRHPFDLMRLVRAGVCRRPASSPLSFFCLRFFQYLLRLISIHSSKNTTPRFEFFFLTNTLTTSMTK